jgi:hypothetical protein
VFDLSGLSRLAAAGVRDSGMLVAIGAMPYARSLGIPTPPRGVAADHWISMGDAAGFVITGNASDPKKPALPFAESPQRSPVLSLAPIALR